MVNIMTLRYIACMVTHSDVLDRLRQSIHGRQGKTADAIGVTQSGLSRYLSGDRPLSLELFMRLCAELEIEPAEVLQ